MILSFLINGLLLFSGIFNNSNAIEKTYIREYYSTGELKAEGWQMENKKVDYWIYYYQNGTTAKKGPFKDNQQHGYWYFYSPKKSLLKEGHFKQGKEYDWWILYENEFVKKLQFINGKKEGFALVYSNGNLEKAEKYENDKKIGEWTSFYKFKRDNPEVKI